MIDWIKSGIIKYFEPKRPGEDPKTLVNCVVPSVDVLKDGILEIIKTTLNEIKDENIKKYFIIYIEHLVNYIGPIRYNEKIVCYEVFHILEKYKHKFPIHANEKYNTDSYKVIWYIYQIIGYLSIVDNIKVWNSKEYQKPGAISWLFANGVPIYEKFKENDELVFEITNTKRSQMDATATIIAQLVPAEIRYDYFGANVLISIHNLLINKAPTMNFMLTWLPLKIEEINKYYRFKSIDIVKQENSIMKVENIKLQNKIEKLKEQNKVYIEQINQIRNKVNPKQEPHNSTIKLNTINDIDENTSRIVNKLIKETTKIEVMETHQINTVPQDSEKKNEVINIIKDIIDLFKMDKDKYKDIEDQISKTPHFIKMLNEDIYENFRKYIHNRSLCKINKIEISLPLQKYIYKCWSEDDNRGLFLTELYNKTKPMFLTNTSNLIELPYMIILKEDMVLINFDNLPKKMKYIGKVNKEHIYNQNGFVKFEILQTFPDKTKKIIPYRFLGFISQFEISDELKAHDFNHSKIHHQIEPTAIE